MMSNRVWSRGWLAVLSVAVLGVACGPPAELVAERDALKTKVLELESGRKLLEKEVDTASARIRSLERELSTAQREVALARLGVQPGDALGVRFVTSLGTVRCALWPAEAPITVANFVQLAEGTKTWTDPTTKAETQRPLYNGTLFHRVIPKFMIQGGDPLGTGRGGPGYRFADEDNGKKFDEPGLLAMANAGPDTNGSQFFITDRATPRHLDGKHTIFGKCQDLDVVQAIATAEQGPGNRPKTDVVLRKVEILRGAAATDI